MSSFRPPLPSPSASDSGDEFDPQLERLDLSRLRADAPEGLRYERKMGDSELSYYLPSRASGVNDMYLHLGMKAPERLMHRERVLAVWTALRLRHPLLASQAIINDYDDVRFVFTPASSAGKAETEAARHFSWEYRTKDELIDAYLNGPRTLSNERLSYLIVSRTPVSDPYPSPPQTPASEVSPDGPEAWEEERTHDYEWFMCAAHFIGDGMALHTFANEFFGLLAGPLSDQELHQLVVSEWEKRWKTPISDGVTQALPPSLEESFPAAKGRFHQAVGRVDFEQSQSRQIGGQAFPRRKDPVRHTIVPTHSFDEKTTKAMLKKCKEHNVSIAGALFAICNIVWARMSPKDRQTLPMMMYAAMNVRPCLVPRPMNDSYWFLAVGYFNVVLPSFIPSSGDVTGTFWHRARSAKTQIVQAAKTPMLVSRAREMSLKRGKQSRAWAREDDEKANGTWVPPVQTAPTPAAAQVPSTALIGLSMLGNLDAMYKHASFPEIKLHTLTTGSRQRHGAMLLFGYTFAGKLWVSLGYDENGFEPKPVRQFWDGMLSAMAELLL